MTPYMHAMVYHIPTFLQNYKTIKLFTGQGVEKKKNNDMARAIVVRKSNKWNAPADILKLESRQWNLHDSDILGTRSEGDKEKQKTKRKRD